MSDIVKSAAIKELAARELEKRHNIYRNSFKSFVIEFFRRELNKEFVWNWHHQVQFEALEELYSSDEQDLLIVNVHPGSGKTEIFSKMYPVWKMGVEDDFWFMDIGYSSDLTKDFSSDAKSYVESEFYQNIFPRIQLDKKQRSKEFWKTTNSGRYYAVGVGGTITGKRADLITIDDPINPKDILSKNQLDKTNDWFARTLKSRRRVKKVDGIIKRGKIVIIMQRLHDNDLCGYLQREFPENFEVGKYKIVSIPAISKTNEKYREKGESMFPQFFPLSFLESEKEASKKDMGMNHFSAQYQQDPVDSENAVFRREYFRYYLPDDLTKKGLQTTIGVDAAISEKLSADFRSIVVVSKSNDAEFFVRANVFGRWTPSDFIDQIFFVVSVFNNAPVVLEKSGNDWFIVLLKKEMAARGVFFRLIIIPSRGNKENRLQNTLEPLYSNFRVFHREEDKYGQLEDEILRFPKSAHDDNMDALETAISQFSFSKAKDVNGERQLSIKKRLNYIKRQRAEYGI